MDRLQRFVEGSQFAVAVLLNVDHSDCELVSVRPFTPRTNLDEEIASRNLHCVGVIGIVDSEPKHEWTEPLPASTLAGLSRAFVAYFEVLLTTAQRDDFAVFMTNLFSLGQYDSLLAQGKDKEATDLLKGTRESAVKSLEIIKQAIAATHQNDHGPAAGGVGADTVGASGAMAAINAYKRAGLEKRKAAQEEILKILDAQLTVEQKSGTLRKQDGDNATLETAKTLSAQRSAAARAAAESQLRMGEMVVAADRATAEAQLQVKRASIQARLETDIAFAAKDRDVQLAGNAAQLKAVDKMADGYPNAVKQIREKALEIEQQFETKRAELTAKATTDQAAKDLAAIETAQREKIDATQQGSAARLAAVDKAIRTEQSLNLQDTAFYRELLTQREDVARQMAEEAGKRSEEAGKQSAENEEKMGSLSVQALKDHYAAVDLVTKTSAQQRLTQAIQIANGEYDIKRRALEQQKASVDPDGHDAANKQRQLQNEMITLQKEHEQQLQQIRHQSNQQQIQETQTTLANVASQYATNAFQIAMGRQSLTRTMNQMAESAARNMTEALMQEICMHKSAQFAAAERAAASAYSAMSGIPVVGPVLGAIAAGTVFAGAMAFAGGTDMVPGIGRGDLVPAMLTPGEGVVPGGVMDKLRSMASRGQMESSGHHVHVHVHYRPTIHANLIDGDGVRGLLDKHGEEFTRHTERTLRRMNK